MDFATAPPPPGVPYLDADNPGPSDPATKAALEVMTALRPEVAGQVGRIAAPSVAAITLTLTDGRVVVWGTTDRTEEKALKLGALLTQPGQTYDVSSPDLADRQVARPVSCRTRHRSRAEIQASREEFAFATIARRRACMDTSRPRPTVLVARNNLT